jgi:hypothetical protein
MLVFLLQDTIRDAPVGFENDHRNIFDPADDMGAPTGPKSGFEERHIQERSTPEKRVGHENDGLVSRQEQSENNKDDEVDQKPNADADVCVRTGCTNKPRFDSIFCSDACGVSALENDLLRTFFYSSDIHPSSFRH